MAPLLHPIIWLRRLVKEKPEDKMFPYRSTESFRIILKSLDNKTDDK